MTSATPSRNRPLRWAFFGFLLLFALGILALLASNALLLSRSICEWVSDEEELGFKLCYAYGWSIRPGMVHLRDVRISGIDDNVTWEVRVDELRVRVSLADLREKIFHGRKLNGKGVQVTVVQHSEAERPRIMAKLREQDRLNPPQRPPPWKVRIENVTLEDVRSVSLDALRFEGNSRILGSFFLHPKTFLRLDGGEWAIASGVWTNRGDRMASGFQAHSKVTIHPTDLTVTLGSEIFRTMDIHARAESRQIRASILSIPFASYEALRFREGEGVLSGKLDVNRGRILPGSGVRLSVHDARLELLGLRLDGRVNFQGEAFHWRENKTPALALDFELDRLTGRAGSVSVVQGGRIRISGRSEDLSLVSPFEDLRLDIRAEDLKLRRLEALAAHLSRVKSETLPFAAEEGELQLNASVFPERKEARIRFRLRSPKLIFNRRTREGRDQWLETNANLTSTLVAQDYGPGSFSLPALRMDMDGVAIHRERERPYRRADWKGSVRFDRGHVHFGEPFGFSGRFFAEFTDLRIPARFATEPSFWVKTGLWLYPFENLKGRGRVALHRNNVALFGLRFQSGSQRIAGNYFLRDGEEKGRFYFGVAPVPLCYAAGEQGGLAPASDERACIGSPVENVLPRRPSIAPRRPPAE